MPVNKPPGGPSDQQRRPLPSKESEGDENPSSTLWVGSLSSATLESDLMAAFSKYGALDCTTMHGARNYSFLYFRTAEEAKAAKKALQGTSIQGGVIRVEFARPAKAAKQIWVGGFGSTITKKQLEDEFLKFGKIQDYNFFKDRHSAIIEYGKMEDAIAAHKTMNGKLLAGEQLRIDFVRFQPPRRDWPDRYDSRVGSMLSYDMQIFHESNYLGSKRDMLSQPPVGRRDGPPSNVLWIGYPPSVQIDEQMLHNAMILFGELERVKCFPSRNYSFVEFRNVDEARRAKEGLQGRLFNDPRIQIFFSSSEFAPKDNLSQFPGLPTAELFANENPFGLSVAPNSFPGHLHPSGLLGSSALIRPFGLQGHDPHHSGLEIQDISGVSHNFLDPDARKILPSSLRHRSPSAPGILPSPSGILPHRRLVSNEHDVFDMRESKRSRADSSIDDGFSNMKRYGGGIILDHPYGLSQPDRGSASRSRHSPAVRERSSPVSDYCWRGVIAKGGSHVCYARCIPIGKGLASSLSDVVNCSARTELEKLTEHYAEAIGFDIVFFLPDSEEDFASYTEFLRYLGSKSRAGVVKLEDGATLFLVPPSDFLTKVLRVNGPERLYGVVLKFTQQSSSGINPQQQAEVTSTAPGYADQMDSSNFLKGHPYVPINEIQSPRVDYDQSFNEEAADRSVKGKSLLAHSDLQRTAQSSNVLSSGNSVATSKAVALTPELLATLASFLPSNTQTSGVQVPAVSTVSAPTPSASVLNGSSMQYKVGQEHQVGSLASFEPTGLLSQQLGQQYISQTQPSLVSPFGNISGGMNHNAQALNASLQVQNPSVSMPQIPLNNNYSMSQSGQFATMQNNQLLYDGSSTSHNSYGMPQIANAAEVYGLGVQQQPQPNLSFHDQMVPQSQAALPLPTERPTQGFIAQGTHMPTVLPGPGEGASQSDADKNQQYQSTLQLAANLLFQLQQKQLQQANSNASQPSGKQP